MSRWIALTLLILPVLASAQQTTYTFSGSGLSTPCACGASNVGPPVGSTLAGSVTLANPLPYSGTVTVTPTAFSFNSNLGMLQSSFLATVGEVGYPDEYMSTSFVFTTTDGQITGWTISLTAGVDQLTEGATITDAIDFYQMIQPYNCSAQTCYAIAASGGPGTWTGVTAAQPAATPDPLAAQVAALQTQVTQLQAQVAYYQSWQSYWQWQSTGTKERLATVQQLLTNANNEIAALKAKLAAK
jgi:hypothetical protein